MAELLAEWASNSIPLDVSLLRTFSFPPLDGMSPIASSPCIVCFWYPSAFVSRLKFIGRVVHLLTHVLLQETWCLPTARALVMT